MNLLLRIKLIKSAIMCKYYREMISLILFLVLVKIKNDKLFIKTNVFNPLLYIIMFIAIFIMLLIELYRFLIEFKKDFLHFNNYSVSWTSGLHRFNKIFYNK